MPPAILVRVKGTIAQDFLLHSFLVNHLRLGPWFFCRNVPIIFSSLLRRSEKKRTSGDCLDPISNLIEKKSFVSFYSTSRGIYVYVKYIYEIMFHSGFTIHGLNCLICIRGI
jgi:hypothetical protein